jgi:phenylacetate-coenzyme A ligase PaaK-like adenylate-forming protein
MFRSSASLFNFPLSAPFDSVRWAEAAFDVWQGSQLDRAEIEALARRRLAALIEYVREASPFYAHLYRKLPVAPQLTDLPPVRKRELMNQFDRVVTRPELTRRVVDEFVSDGERLGSLLFGRYSVWTSSGTTGEPGVFVQDAGALAVYDALEAQRFRGLRSSADLARQLIEGDRYALVAATGGHFAGVATVERMRRALPWLGSVLRSFSLLQPIEQLVAQLHEYRPTLLATYPTAADMLADEQQSGCLRLRLREIWTGGEYLSEATRRRLQRVFGCRVRSGYGASEFMAMAWECPHQQLHLNSDWVLLEPIDRHDRPLGPGVRSHSVLLTNLANRVQPLLRYDLGDSVTISDERCACGSEFPVIFVEGRHDDALVLPLQRGGCATVVPLALATALEEGSQVHDFQVVQRAPGILSIRLGPAEHAPARSVRRSLAAYFQTLGVADLRVEFPPGAPRRDARSGKLRRVICRVPATPRPR